MKNLFGRGCINSDLPFCGYSCRQWHQVHESALRDVLRSHTLEEASGSYHINELVVIPRAPPESEEESRFVIHKVIRVGFDRFEGQVRILAQDEVDDGRNGVWVKTSAIPLRLVKRHDSSM